MKGMNVIFLSILVCLLTLEMSYCRSVPVNMTDMMPPMMKKISPEFIADELEDSKDGLDTSQSLSTAPPMIPQ